MSFSAMLLSLLTGLHCFSNFQAQERSKMKFKEEYFEDEFANMVTTLKCSMNSTMRI